MQWNRLACACAAISLSWTATLGQTSRTEDSPKALVEIALQRNRDYLAARTKVSEADALLRQAGIRPTPSIEIEGASGKLLGSSGESVLSAAYFHTIETGGKRDKRIQVAERAKAVAQAEVDEYQRQLTFEIKTRYFEALTQERKLSAISRLIPVNRQNYQMTASRVELGDAPPLEQQLLLTDVNRTEAQQAIFSARFEAKLLELKTAVGLAPSDSLQLPPDFVFESSAQTLTELTEYALKNRPDLRVLGALEEQNSAEAEQARSEGRPDVTASARYSRINSRFDQFGFSNTGAVVPIQDHDNIATFGLAIPLFTKKRTDGAVSAALARKTQAQLRREYLLQTIPQEVEAAYRRWSGAQRTLLILKSGVIEQSEKNLTVIREAYRLGQLRLFDVLNEQRKLIETELAFVDVQAEAAQALAELEKACGGTLP